MVICCHIISVPSDSKVVFLKKGGERQSGGGCFGGIFVANIDFDDGQI